MPARRAQVDGLDAADEMSKTPPPSQAKKLVLKMALCPGDELTMTAAVESLHATYPGRYLTDVRTPTEAIWQSNPHISKIADGDREATVLPMQYPSIHRCNEVHTPFLAGYTEFLAEKLGVPLTLTTNRPHLYLTEAEQSWRDQIQDAWPELSDRRPPFWLLNAGVKADYTAKQWPVEYYERVVAETAGRILWVQIGGREHNHPHVRGALDLRGRTDHRQLIRLAYHAAGGLGPVTYLQHLMAAWEKPYVCLVGGREPATWVQYPLQHTLHTLGQLDCCRTRACWKARVVPLGDGDAKDGSLCEHPVLGWTRAVGKCMTMIRPEAVIEILARFT